MANALSFSGVGDYGQYQMWHSYSTDLGIITVPIAGVTEAHVTIRIHGGLGVRNVNWTASRAEKPPIIPSLTGDLIDGGDEIQGFSVRFSQQPNEKSSGFNWNCEGSYQYIQPISRIPGNDTFPTNAYPYVINPQLTLSATLLSLAGGSMKTCGIGLDYVNNGFVWPHTFFPHTSTNDSLITTLPSV